MEKTCVIVELTIMLGVEWDAYVLKVIENLSWMDDSGYLVSNWYDKVVKRTYKFYS